MPQNSEFWQGLKATQLYKQYRDLSPSKLSSPGPDIAQAIDAQNIQALIDETQTYLTFKALNDDEFTEKFEESMHEVIQYLNSHQNVWVRVQDN